MGQIITSLMGLVPLETRLWLGRFLYKPLNHHVFRVSPGRVLKLSSTPGELEALDYIREHTRIPVPRVYATHLDKHGRMCIEMEYVRGETLSSAWMADGRLSEAQKETICGELQGHVAAMRRLTPPSEDLVASALGNPAHDLRIGTRFFGPFTHGDLIRLSRRFLLEEDIHEVLGPDVERMHTAMAWRTCFTHGDLVPRNIIVRDGHVAAVIDWENAGWYPEFWEYTKGHYDYFPRRDWMEHFRRIVPAYDRELAAEQALWEILPDPGTPGFMLMNGVESVIPSSKPSNAWREVRGGRRMEALWRAELALHEHEKGWPHLEKEREALDRGTQAGDV